MASRVEFAVIATPIYSHAAGEGAAVDVIATDVGKSVGGNGSVSVTWGSTSGYSAGVPSYINSNGAVLTCTSAKFLYVKHTGYKYASSSTLGEVATANVQLYVGDFAYVVAYLKPGESVIIPLKGTESNTYKFAPDGADQPAVEYFWTV